MKVEANFISQNGESLFYNIVKRKVEIILDELGEALRKVEVGLALNCPLFEYLGKGGEDSGGPRVAGLGVVVEHAAEQGEDRDLLRVLERVLGERLQEGGECAHLLPEQGVQGVLQPGGARPDQVLLEEQLPEPGLGLEGELSPEVGVQLAQEVQPRPLAKALQHLAEQGLRGSQQHQQAGDVVRPIAVRVQKLVTFLDYFVLL
jgi:hypothetical protein